MQAGDVIGTYVYPERAGYMSWITLGSVLNLVICLVFLSMALYLMYLAIKALRIYINKNS